MIKLNDYAKGIIREGKEHLKDEDYDEFFNSIYLQDQYWYNSEIYQFIMFEAGIDLLHKMSYIPKGAFSECKYNLGDLVIPSNIKKIGRSAFQGCNTLTSIDLSKTKITEIDKECFSENESLEKVLLPDTVYKIDIYAFEYCRKLNYINLKDVKRIENYAFQFCDELKEDTVPFGSFDYCSSNAFVGCKNFDLPW